MRFPNLKKRISSRFNHLRPKQIIPNDQFYNRLTQLFKLFIALITFYWAVVQFFYSQNLIDRRKYYNSYYDERFKVLTQIAYSTSRIYSIVSNEDSLSTISKDTIKNNLLIFNYASLVLDKRKSDSIILFKIELYLDCIYEIIAHRRHNCEIEELYKLNKEILENAGKIFSSEKDSINSFRFKLFPFGKS